VLPQPLSNVTFAAVDPVKRVTGPGRKLPDEAAAVA